ncbi:MAG: DUF1302 domain-containing protein [Aquabacterium sp.]|nr:DUF1302 domain-containing protein [Aquabacterium sp.]
MNRTQKNKIVPIVPTVKSSVVACHMACAVMGAVFVAAQAQAGEVTLDNGATVEWKMGASLGSSVRMAGPDRELIGVGNGGTGINGMDDGNLNFKKGSVFSTLAKFDAEMTVKQDGMGLVLGGRAWFDHRLKNRGVNHGSNANGYVQGSRLDDSQYDSGSKFTNTELGNAYAFGSFDITPSTNLSVKAGNQVVNWGQSLFIPGVNNFGAFNATEANRAGAQVKDILLPIPQISANLGLGGGLSIEAFYQLAWKKSVLDGCGTYWSLADSLNCSNRAVVSGDVTMNIANAALGLGNPALSSDYYLHSVLTPAMGGPFASAANTTFLATVGSELKPKDDGQFGLSATYNAESIDTEFGVYYANYHARTPIISYLNTPSVGPSFWFNRLPSQIFWDYSAQNIHVLAGSASTVVGGWSLMGEASFTKDIPVQINPVDLIVARTGAGNADLIARVAATPLGGVFHAYDLKNKTQLQVSTVKIFPSFVNADSLTLIGELGVQHWSGIGDPYTSTRYGRGFGFGYADSSARSCAQAASSSQNTGTNKHCENKGFVTSNAWGYRILAELSYPDLFLGVNFKPRMFISHDVKGYSADSTFIEDRVKLSLGAKFEYNKQYYADFSFTGYNRGATYDQMHDRSYFAATVGMSF